MRFSRLAGAAAFVWAGAAQAATPMVVTYATWMRAGPSPWAKEIEELDAGWPVSVLGCSEGWCNVTSGRASGYVAAALLAAGGNAPTQPVPGAACLPGTHQTPERAILLKICPAEARSP